eukprot:10827762-Ditylum_brightwellii.AAC.1
MSTSQEGTDTNTQKPANEVKNVKSEEMEEEQNTLTTSRRASDKDSDTSLVGKKKKKMGDGVTKKSRKGHTGTEIVVNK